jgi:hypothetical protein
MIVDILFTNRRCYIRRRRFVREEKYENVEINILKRLSHELNWAFDEIKMDISRPE